MSFSKSLEPTHNKIIARFDILISLLAYVKNAAESFDNGKDRVSKKKSSNRKKNKVKEFMDFWNAEINCTASDINTIIQNINKSNVKLNALQGIYFDNSSSILCDYFSEKNVKNNERYYSFLISNNLLDQMETIKQNIDKIVVDLEVLSGFKSFAKKKNFHMCKSFYDVLDSGISDYDDNLPELPSQTLKNDDLCPHCGGTLVLFPEESEKQCDDCGFVEELKGTLFEDSQFYNQQITCVKHKKHNPNQHCWKWLCQIQGKENRAISQRHVEMINQCAVKEYTRAGIKRDMGNMKCSQVRNWLKDLHLSRLNNHAPLVRKIITGLNGEPILPPQLSAEEEQIILNDFDEVIKIFADISRDRRVLAIFNKTTIKNNLYYPFFILKIMMFRMKGDGRLPALVECIHLQSAATLIKDDLLWKIMCEYMPEYVYEPTNPTMLVGIY
jgi:hypothetical protein